MNSRYLLNQAKYYKSLGKGHLKRMFFKFLFAKTPLSKTVNSKMYNKIYRNIVNKKTEKIKPFLLQIETTDICNAKCIMCPHISMKRKKRTMNLKDFIKICKNVLDYEKIEVITVSGFGEPFLDKGIIDKIKWVNDNYPKIKVDIYTNASFLDKKITEELLKLKVHKINFSINGTEESYKKIMALDYNLTKENILYFLNKKKELELKYPLTNISLMIISENKNEVDKIINFWLEKTDSVMAYLPSDWAGNLKGITSANARVFKFKRWPCKVLWTSVTVDVDGNVVMCCRDYESRVKFGNLLKKNIKEIRESEEFKELLEKQKNYDFSSPVCNMCDNSFDSSLDWLA